MHTTNGTWLALLVAAVLCTTPKLIKGDFNIEPLILQANIFYQRPLTLGPPSELPLERVEQLVNPESDIKVIIHGFTASRTHVSIRPVGNAFMAVGTTNVFLADWSAAAALDYHSSRKAVGKVSIFLAKILQSFLIRLEIQPTAVHVIGHSLGAHIAGGIGQYFNGTLGRVTGLDPALPLFTPLSLDGLHASAAQFVDVIHTDYPVFGDITPRGTADFYPNFGHTPQRGCEDIDIVTANSCSHNRAVLLYAESIAVPKSFPATPCSLHNIKQRVIQNCLLASVSKATASTAPIKLEELNDDVVDDESIYMGEYVSKSAKGSYYLETFDTTPFGMGLYSKLLPQKANNSA